MPEILVLTSCPRSDTHFVILSNYLGLELSLEQEAYLDAWQPISHFTKEQYNQVAIPDKIRETINYLVEESCLVDF